MRNPLFRGVHLRNDHYFCVAEHGQVAGLAVLCATSCISGRASATNSLQRMMPVGEFKKFQRELETFVG